jgi:23S rRNA pseudouridine1911/1915/1917 synthase
VTELRVPPQGAGTRLDVFLAEHVGSRSRAQRLIEAGRVRVDGAPVPKRRTLAGGELVEVDEDASPAAAPPAAAPPSPSPPGLTIPYRDADLLVVDKPAGVVVHPARGHRDGTLVQILGAEPVGGEDPDRPGIVHRLDKDTSGLLVVARTDAALRALREALRERRVEREYLALVEGRPPARSGTIDAPLGRDRRVRTRVSVDTDDPRDAVTYFEIDEALPRSTLLRVTLETGRTHQIRAHLVAIGHPVAGDPEYGTAGLYGLQRQFLHAARLAFPHPVSGERIEVRSRLPDDLQEALARARG